MKKIFSVFLLMVIFSGLVFAQKTDKGTHIIQEQKKQNTGFQSESSQVTMVIVSRSGVKTERSFKSFYLEEKPKAGAKALIKVIAPADLNGVGLLTHSHAGSNNDQWLYLSATRKTKRIAGTNKTGRFLGSDFTYEDLRPRVIEDYTYVWLREESCSLGVEAISLSGICDVIEVFPKNNDSAYSKMQVWVRRSDTQTVRMSLFDKKNLLSKEALFLDYKKYLGKYYRAHLIIMKDLIKNKHTELFLKDYQLQAGLQDADFSTMALER